MLKKEQINQIKQILNSGYDFDLDLVAFEYDASLEEIIKIKNEIEAEKTKTRKEADVDEILNTGRKIALKTDKKIASKISKMKTKYQLETKSKNTEYKIARRELNEEQRAFVLQVIETAEKDVEEHKNDTGLQRRDLAWNVVKNIRKILDLNCDLNSSELARMWHIISSETFKKLTLFRDDNILKILQRTKKTISRELGNAISYERKEAKDDIEKLEALQRLITRDMASEDYLNLGNLSNTILTQITSIKSKKKQEEVKKRIPEEFIGIITAIKEDNLDLEEANRIIEDLVKKQKRENSNTNFSLTEEQIRKTIITKIIKVFETQPIRYNFKDPKKAIKDLVSLGGDKATVVKSVLQNLIRKRRVI